MNILLPRFLRGDLAPSKDQPSASAAYTARMASPVRTLLVEDSAMDREIIAKRLHEWNIVVTEATAKAEAIGLANTAVFDVAMVDMRLPWVGNGIAVMQALRRQNPDIPICAYSGAYSGPMSGSTITSDVERICQEVGPVTVAPKLTTMPDTFYRQLFVQFRLAKRAGMLV
jgi:CheY-like chemotaxis protein